MAGISKKTYKTKNGKIIIKYVITYRDIKGKQHTIGGFPTKREAQSELYKYEKRKTNDKIKIGSLFFEFIKDKEEKNRAKNTIIFYRSHWENHLKQYENICYNKISTFDWQKIIFQIKNSYGIYVAKACHSTLRAMFNYSYKYKLISENTFIGVDAPELTKSELNHFEIKELLRLLEIAKEKFSFECYTLLYCFIATGMREGEIFGLLKSKVDFETNKIHVCTQYTNYEFKEKTKTKKSNRIVYMFPTFAKILKFHIENDETESPFVFHNSKGKPLNQSNVRNRFWIKLLEHAGYPKYYARLHDLRGSNADAALELGLSITFAKDNLGHSAESTTLKHYVKSNQSIINEGMEKFEEAFNLKKHEQNVSKKEQLKNSKIIIFPKSNKNKV